VVVAKAAPTAKAGRSKEGKARDEEITVFMGGD
jgi:hypothetical protein